MEDNEKQRLDLNLEDRKQLIDAARESIRTFDQAVLTFGAAVFGFSIAFLKDIAPKPVPETLCWLAFAWGLLSTGLIAILFSFLSSHKACLFELDTCTKRLVEDSPEAQRPNRWSTVTYICNVMSILLIVGGLACWSKFAFANLSYGGMMSKDKGSIEERGYVPHSAPPKAPPAVPAAPQDDPKPAPPKK